MAREFVTGVRFAQVAALPAAASNAGIVLEQGGKLWFSDGAAWVDLGAVGGGGVTDGDKGDVTVSSGGTVWTVDTVQVGTVTGQFARWNNTTGRYEAFDLLGTSNTWTQDQFITSLRLRVGSTSIDSGRVEAVASDSLAAANGGVFIGGFLGAALTKTPAAIGNRSRVLGGAYNEQGVLFSNSADPFDIVCLSGVRINGSTAWHSGNSAQAIAGTVTGQVALWNQTTGRYEPGSAPAAGAGGSNGQVQYNNSGTISGMANVTHESGRLVHADYEEFALQSAAVATPAAGRGRIYMRQRAGRVTLDTIGPSGVDNALQPAFFNNRVMMISPNTTTSVSAVGLSATTAATLSHPALSSASLAQSIYRTRCQTSTTAGNAAGIRHSVATMLRGNATALGGFYFHARVCSGSIALAGGQAFVGLSSSVAALAGEPSALADCVGLAKDTADTAWQFVRRTGTGTVQKVALTTPLTYAVNQVIDVIVFSRPGGTGLGCVVRSFSNAGVPTTHLDTEYTDNLPAVGTFLAGRFDIRNGATAAAADFELVRMYAESDF